MVATPIAANSRSLALKMASAAAAASASTGPMKWRALRPRAVDRAAQQLRRARVACPGDRAPARGEADQDAEQGRLRQARSIAGSGRARPASKRAGKLGDQRRCRRPDRQPGEDRQPGDQPELDQQHRVDRPPRRADQLQDGDALAARGGEGGGGARHAKPADRQRRQRHHQQQLAEPVDEAARPAAGVVAVGRAPAAVGKALLERLADRLGIGAAREGAGGRRSC